MLSRLRPPIWLILTTLAFAQDDAYRVTPKFERPLNIEELLARVDPEKDAWIGERDFESIHRKLDEIARNLRERRPTLARLDEIARRFADVAGKIGAVSAITDGSFRVSAQGGVIEVLRARGEDGKKVSGGDFARAAGLAAGTLLGS